MAHSEATGTPSEEVRVRGHEMKHFDESSPKGKLAMWMYANKTRLEVALIALIVADVLLLSTEAVIDNHWACVNGEVVHGASQEQLRGSVALNVGEDHNGVQTFRKRLRWQQFLGIGDGEGRGADDHVDHNHIGGHGEHAPAEVLTCETKNGHTAHHIAHTCHLLSIVILCYFMTDLLIKMWLDPHEFFESLSECVDLLIVSVSLAIDVFLLCFKHSADLEWIPVILVCCRFWRIVRITHAAYEVVAIERKHWQDLSTKLAEAEAELAKLKAAEGRSN